MWPCSYRLPSNITSAGCMWVEKVNLYRLSCILKRTLTTPDALDHMKRGLVLWASDQTPPPDLRQPYATRRASSGLQAGRMQEGAGAHLEAVVGDRQRHEPPARQQHPLRQVLQAVAAQVQLRQRRRGCTACMGHLVSAPATTRLLHAPQHCTAAQSQPCAATDYSSGARDLLLDVTANPAALQSSRIVACHLHSSCTAPEMTSCHNGRGRERSHVAERTREGIGGDAGEGIAGEGERAQPRGMREAGGEGRERAPLRDDGREAALRTSQRCREGGEARVVRALEPHKHGERGYGFWELLEPAAGRAGVMLQWRTLLIVGQSIRVHSRP